MLTPVVVKANVSHCMSLSSYLLDAIVISDFPAENPSPSMTLQARLRAGGLFHWETP
jgi:hypothetical protein